MSSIEEVRGRVVLLEVEIGRLQGLTSDLMGTLMLEHLALLELSEGSTNPTLLTLVDEVGKAHGLQVEASSQLLVVLGAAGDALSTM